MQWGTGWSLKNGRDVLSFTYELLPHLVICFFYTHVFLLARGFTFCSLKCLLLILNLSGCPFKSVIILTLSYVKMPESLQDTQKPIQSVKFQLDKWSTFLRLLRCQQTWPTLQATWEVPKSLWVVPYLKCAFSPIGGDLMRPEFQLTFCALLKASCASWEEELKSAINLADTPLPFHLHFPGTLCSSSPYGMCFWELETSKETVKRWKWALPKLINLYKNWDRNV